MLIRLPLLDIFDAMSFSHKMFSFNRWTQSLKVNLSASEHCCDTVWHALLPFQFVPVEKIELGNGTKMTPLFLVFLFYCAAV